MCEGDAKWTRSMLQEVMPNHRHRLQEWNKTSGGSKKQTIQFKSHRMRRRKQEVRRINAWWQVAVVAKDTHWCQEWEQKETCNKQCEWKGVNCEQRCANDRDHDLDV